MIRIEGTELMREYRQALKEIENFLEAQNQEWDARYGRRFILQVNSRIKSSESIEKKLRKKGLPQDLETAVEKLSDMAGLQVVVSFLDDVFRVRTELRKWPGVSIQKEKDFIRHPKRSGYRSYHLICKVPVDTPAGPKEVTIEVQLRTMVMHLWAELDHDRFYKTGVQPEALEQTLRLCARTGRKLDDRMQKARKIMDYDEKRGMTHDRA